MAREDPPKIPNDSHCYRQERNIRKILNSTVSSSLIAQHVGTVEEKSCLALATGIDYHAHVAGYLHVHRAAVIAISVKAFS
jgi:hypothetical protein